MTKLKRPRDEIIGQERAQRIRQLREHFKYSRQKFCEKHVKYSIKASTLQSWETVRWNGLSEGGAEILVQIFKEEGLNVTRELLLFGIGENPLSEPLSLDTDPAVVNLSSEQIIAQELALFHQLNPNMIDTVVTDDSLAPWLKPGDRVAGKRLFGEAIKKALDCPCIIQTLAGAVLVGWLKEGQQAEHYLLMCTNPDPDACIPESVIKDIKLFSAAPILWIRKPDL